MRKHESIRQELQKHFNLKPDSKEFNETVRKFARLFGSMSKNGSISERFTNLDDSHPNHFNVRICGMNTLERDTFFNFEGKTFPLQKGKYINKYIVSFELFNITDDQINHPWMFETSQVFAESEINYLSNFPHKEDDFLDVIEHIKNEFDHYHEMIKTIESFGYVFHGNHGNGDFAFGRLLQEKIDDRHDLFAELELEHGSMTARIVHANGDEYLKDHHAWPKGTSYKVEQGDFIDAVVSFEKTIILKRLKRNNFTELNPSLRDAITMLGTPLRFTES